MAGNTKHSVLANLINFDIVFNDVMNAIEHRLWQALPEFLYNILHKNYCISSIVLILEYYCIKY